MTQAPDQRPRLLLVDDEPTNLQVLRHVLQADYRLLFATDGARALQVAREQRPDLVLLDIMMPHMDGYAVCRALKADAATASTPVIFVTALSDTVDETRGFDVGAVDYITKPVNPAVVRARVRTHLSLVRMDELRRTRLEIVQRLGLAAEYKDNQTGRHMIRMSHFSHRLALALGQSPHEAEDLLHAAPMHDVGKIGIPDRILQKAGPLDADEWKVMQSHATIGAEIIGEHADGMLDGVVWLLLKQQAQIGAELFGDNPWGLLRMGGEMALNHHEKWDGSGYPRGISGAEIPVEARIIAIADVFDALTSERPYKKAWSVEEAVQLLRAEAGRHFDPQLVELFLAQMPALLQIKARWAEEQGTASR